MADPPADQVRLVAELGLPTIAAAIFHRRGLTERDAIKDFLAPRLGGLPDPATIPDIGPAVARLADAVAHGERIVIYGDFDADGVTATAMVHEFLSGAGAVVEWYIPDRQEEGYGLNPKAIQTLLAKGTRVLVTVDCGSTAHQEVAMAQAGGMDVVITDHHLLQDELPPALAVINPQRQDSDFAGRHLAGVGVAFHLVAALRAEMRRRGMWAHEEPDIRDLLDLVALGTVADVVPLQAENRILVASGLRQLSTLSRPGVAALARMARLGPPFSAMDIAFKLAPRINARGRLSRADDGVELLITRDPRQAHELAGRLDQANSERQRIEQEVLAACLERVASQPRLLRAHSLVLADQAWHPGVVGIVAGRLAERFHRPAFVVGRNGRGSGRSIPQVHLLDLLDMVGGLLAEYGGHHAAAGLRISDEHVGQFRDAFEEALVARHGDQPFIKTLEVDASLHLDAIDQGLIGFLDRLEPCGYGNKRPVFTSEQVSVRRIEVFGTRHLKLYLDHPNISEAVGFGMAEQAPALGDQVDLAYSIAENTYQGVRSTYLKLRDVRS